MVASSPPASVPPPSAPPRSWRPPPPPPTVRALGTLSAFMAQLGEVSILAKNCVRAFFRKPFEGREIVRQFESLGVASLGIVVVTSLFIGMVMSTQFAFGLRKFGGMEYTGRVVALTFARELAPTLTAVIVGGRIGAGMTAEIGAMAVTEQLEAIRALGADPVKKLVLPRRIAATIVLPIVGTIAPVKPRISAKVPTVGSTKIEAISRGSTSFFTGSAPSALIASSCSVTAMAPSSAVMPAPMRPPTITAVSVGASSRAKVSATTRPVYSMPPNFCRPKANCVDITMPMNRLVTVTMPIDATPSDSSWRMISRPSNGLRNRARMQFAKSVATSPS